LFLLEKWPLEYSTERGGTIESGVAHGIRDSI
jgi:hypothetical protein